MKLKSIRDRIFKAMGLVTVGNSMRWFWTTIQESFTGAWQRNIETESNESLLTNSAIYACVTGIAGDIAKMRIMLMRDVGGIREEITENSPYLRVLKKPNHYQNRIEFVEAWQLSKLLNGNAYILKQREPERKMVESLYVLDPRLVVTLVAENGDIYYQIRPDPISQVAEQNTVPASEIIHDKMPTLWHPLVGVSPLYACALSGSVGNKIQRKAIDFYDNRAIPGGVISAPGAIPDNVATRIKEAFEKNYAGQNVGRLAILGDGMEFKLMEMTAEAAQMAEQFKMSIDDIARAFHYPLFKLGGALPAYAGNVDALITTYYTDCLQVQIEKHEISLDEGLRLPNGLMVEFDLDGLMRMDTKGLFESNTSAVKGGWLKPDEARKRVNKKPVPGGDSPYLQQQNYSLEALAKRDAQEDPFANSGGMSVPPARDLSDDELEAAIMIGLERETKQWKIENDALY